jgi:hypothetical protein
MPEDKYTPQQSMPEQTRAPIQTHRWIAAPGSAVKRQVGITLVSDGASVDENTVTHVMSAPRRSVLPDPAPSIHATATAAARVASAHGAIVRHGPAPLRHAQELPSVQELMNAHVRSPEPVGVVTSLDAFGLNARRAASGKAVIAPGSPELATLAAGQRAPAEVAVTQEFSFNLKDFVAFEEPTLGQAARTTPQPQSEPAGPLDHGTAETSDVRGLRLAPEDDQLASARRPTKSRRRALVWLGAVIVAVLCLAASDYRKGGKGSLTAKLVTAVSRLALPSASRAAAPTATPKPVRAPRTPAAEQTAPLGALGEGPTAANAKQLTDARDLQADGAAHPEAGKDEPKVAEAVGAAPGTDAPPVREGFSADATTAAELLANGRVREALSEYRVLATLHPELGVYGEIAKILRRRLVNTCKRAQPHRQHECEAL